MMLRQTLMLVASATLTLATPAFADGSKSPRDRALSIATRSGITQNFEPIVEYYVGRTMTAQIVLKKCGPAVALQLVRAGTGAAWKVDGAAWTQGTADVIEELVDPKLLAAADDYSAEQLRATVLGSIDNTKLAAALDMKLRPVSEAAVASVLTSIFDAATKACSS